MAHYFVLAGQENEPVVARGAVQQVDGVCGQVVADMWKQAAGTSEALDARTERYRAVPLCQHAAPERLVRRSPAGIPDRKAGDQNVVVAISNKAFGPFAANHDVAAISSQKFVIAVAAEEHIRRHKRRQSFLDLCRQYRF